MYGILKLAMSKTCNWRKSDILLDLVVHLILLKIVWFVLRTIEFCSALFDKLNQIQLLRIGETFTAKIAMC